NHTIYSDKLCLSVLNLTRIDLATKEDKAYGIDHWAALFKSTTWEEIKMLAQENEDIREASDTIYQLSQEEEIRQQCEAREDYYRRQRSMEVYMQRLENTIQEQNEQLEEKNDAIRQQGRQLEEKDLTIAALLEEIEKLKKDSQA
ncbi:MAG: PD-(D/E)XK nuclease family transposase, partial [Lachnospiraceae bacterium]